MTVCYSKNTSNSQQKKLKISELGFAKEWCHFQENMQKNLRHNKLFRSEITLSTPEHKQHAPWKLF